MLWPAPHEETTSERREAIVYLHPPHEYLCPSPCGYHACLPLFPQGTNTRLHLYMGAMVVGNGGFNSEYYVREPIQNGFHDLFGVPHFRVKHDGLSTSMADTTHLIPIHYGKEDYRGSAHYRCTEFL